MKKYQKEIILIGLIVVITFITFLPMLNNGFTNFDDDLLVTQNPIIKDFSSKNVVKMFTSIQISQYRPLTFLMYSLEYYFFKLDPRVYHATSLILHLINCILVFWLILLLTRNVNQKQNDKVTKNDNKNSRTQELKNLTAAFITAVLFGIHPLHVEPVAWISGRDDLLYTLFYLSSLICYVLYIGKNTPTQSPPKVGGEDRMKYYYLSLAMFILSALSKTLAVTLPIVLIVIDYLQARKLTKKIIIEKAPYFTVSLVFGILAIIIFLFTRSTVNIAGKQPDLIYPDPDKVGGVFLLNIFATAYNVMFYLLKIILPIKLSAIYNYFIVEEGILAFVVVVILLGLILLSRRYSKKVVFCSLFYLATIAPMIDWIPGTRRMSDHYTYLPLLGIIYIVSEGYVWLYYQELKNSKIRKITKILLLIVFIGIIGTLSVLSWRQSQVWKDSITLFTNVLKYYPSIADVYLNRGIAYQEIGKYEQALSDYNQAIFLNPNIAEVYNNRGAIYEGLGKLEQSMADFNQAIKLDPNYADAYSNRGVLYKQQGMTDQSIDDFSQAIKLKPNLVAAYKNRGISYKEQGKYDQAIVDLSIAIKLNPDSAVLYQNRAETYEKIGDHDKSKSDFDRARRIDSSYGSHSLSAEHNTRGIQYGKEGKYQEAIKEYYEAIKYDSNYAEAYNNRGLVYEYLKEYDKAITDYNRAIEINSNLANAYNNRGMVYYKQRQYDKALLDFSKTIDLNDKYKDAYLYRGEIYRLFKEYQQALADFNKAIEIDNKYALAYYHLGRVHYVLGEYEKALSDVAQAEKYGYPVDAGLKEMLKKRSSK